MTVENISSAKADAINKIQTWLNEEKISSKEIDDEYSDFHIAAAISPTRTIDLVINKDRIDSIILVQNMILTDEDKRAFIRLDRTKKKQFLVDLKSSLLHIGVDYAIQPDQEKMQFVQVSRRIYFDGLTKDRFFDVLFQVTRAMELILVKYETHLYHESSSQSFLSSVFYL